MLNPIYRAYAVLSLLLLVFAIPYKAEPRDLTDYELRRLLQNTTVYAQNTETKLFWQVYFASNGRAYYRYTSGRVVMANWVVQSNMVYLRFDDGSTAWKTANLDLQSQFYEWRDANSRRVTSQLIDFKPGDHEGLVPRNPVEPDATSNGWFPGAWFAIVSFFIGIGLSKWIIRIAALVIGTIVTKLTAGSVMAKIAALVTALSAVATVVSTTIQVHQLLSN